MTKLKGLLLTEGMHGMISQVEGLAKALDIDFIHEKIELNNFWKLIPPKITPIHSFVFKNKIDNDLNIVISCGRKSVIPSLFLKKKFKDKIINIHIQDPKVSLSKLATTKSNLDNFLQIFSKRNWCNTVHSQHFDEWFFFYYCYSCN